MSRPDIEAIRERVKGGLSSPDSLVWSSTQQPIMKDFRTLLAHIDTLETHLRAAVEALEFYADPFTYFAIGFWPDPPCGDFMDDWSQHGHPDFAVDDERPGKRARAALALLDGSE